VTAHHKPLKIGDTSTVTIVFSEAVANFDNGDVTVENGTLSTLATSDNITWTGTFTPTNDIEDTTNVISVGTSLIDLVGIVPLAGISTANYSIDIQRSANTKCLALPRLKLAETLNGVIPALCVEKCIFY